MALNTVADMISQVRTLLQDTMVEFRYSDTDIVNAINQGTLEMRRVRPDLFLGRFDALPVYTTSSTTDLIAIDDQYKMALLYYVVSIIQFRDEEETTDSRAAAFMNKFSSQLTTPGG